MAFHLTAMEEQRLSHVKGRQTTTTDNQSVANNWRKAPTERRTNLFLCDFALLFGVLKPRSRVFAHVFIGVTVFFVFTEALRSSSDDDFWDAQFGIPGAGGWGISAMAWADGKLFVGGSLTSLGVTTVTNIGCWDGTNWSALGTGVGRGLGEGVSALAVAGGYIYAAGSFSVAGGGEANNIARWDGSNWYPLGAGVNGDISDMATDGSNIFVGGNFTSAGGIAATNIAQWDGVQWRSLDRGVGRVFAVAADGRSVYVGGKFISASGVATTNIAQWDGTNWHALGNGLRYVNGSSSENGAVRSLLYHGEFLYAGGEFRLAGDLQTANIARWNGVNWEDIGGAANSVLALTANGDALFAGGGFLSIGGAGARAIAMWDGTNWSALGSGMWGGGPLALATSGAELYVGGQFTGAGNKTALNIALWHIPHSLTIHRVQDAVALSWPATGTNFLLEACAALGQTNWQAVPQAPSIIDNQCVVTNVLGPANEFFRLRRR